MISSSIRFQARWHELLFQILIGLMAFYFYVIENERGQIVFNLEPFQIVFFLNYYLVSILIGYVLLPKFFYTKEYLKFSLFTLLTLLPMLFLEEYVLDVFFFPTTREPEFLGALSNIGNALPILIFLVGIKIARDAMLRQKELERLQVMIKESELNFLNSQINPHFLFNNLNNLYSLVVEKSDKAPEVILGLSGILRYMLYECKEPTVPLEKEIHHLKYFAQLYELQIEGRGEINFNTKNIDTDLQITPLILNVFLENAFKHSQAGLSEEIKIDVYAFVNSKNELEFTCVNNFRRPEIGMVERNGIGLTNVKKRLELTYGNNYSLHLNEEAGQFIVELKIPLSKS